MGYCKNAWSDDYVNSAFSLMTDMAKSGFWGTHACRGSSGQTPHGCGVTGAQPCFLAA
ncbi:hypothetical protein CSHISOI_07934 [Colletotrichum shisoi]|uniref:Uncharacterized protein n=1 Tax=Colletotrichum shisoi TaxID=2078593 RepID=A0A5Q4BLB8_9PEZI|nr:hypothetical protein CSHISOI_07934 [Colletotrichum shisoi]